MQHLCVHGRVVENLNPPVSTMDLIDGLFSTCSTQQQQMVKIASCAAFSSVCALGGTFFFTAINPLAAATYFATVAVISQATYHIFAALKSMTASTALKLIFSAMQLLQFSLWFYLLPGPLGIAFSGAQKLEIVNAAAHFLATPIFFHLAIEAYREPTIPNIAYAIGVLLPLGSGLGKYADAWIRT